LPRTWETYIPYGLLGLLLLGIFGFIGYRVFKLKQAETPLEDWVPNEEEPVPTGKRGNFREMAAEYRNKREQQKAASSKKAHSDEVIGLRSLKQMDIVDEPVAKTAKPAQRPESKQEADSTKTLENLLAALQANQLHKAAPKAAAAPPAPKQAVNQYLKAQPQNKPANKSATARDLEYQETLQRELRRAQDIQSQVKKQIQTKQPSLQQRKPNPVLNNAPVNRAPAAKKSAPVSRPNVPLSNGQGPLPGNPEVLNFLRNVADLMEKDGKTDIAKSIHKNLNTQNLGTM
jgi:hypothetical protein